MADRTPVIITTINQISEGIKRFSLTPGCYCIVIGDLKSPRTEAFDFENVIFVSYDSQRTMDFDLIRFLPDNHYSRKNIGYLLAIRNGHETIAESDDDNIPYEFWGEMLGIETAKAFRVVSRPKHVNVYKLFSDIHVWPRGFPLNKLSPQSKIEYRDDTCTGIVIWQGLADDNPDVDAIFRLVYPDQKITFDSGAAPVILEEGLYCPFNSQNTVWHRDAFPFMYLPVSVSFRFTDILRSYVAQRGIHALNRRIAFGRATVFQDRNHHNLLKDFEDEIDCYLLAERVTNILDDCKLTADAGHDLCLMYEKLHEHKIVGERELPAVRAWISDIGNAISYPKSDLDM